MYPSIEIDIHVGDHQQLAPTVVTHEQPGVNPQSDQIKLSLFARHVKLHSHAVKLVVQYRATEGLMWFSNRFYDGQLQDGLGTALGHPSRVLSRQLRVFHKKHFSVSSHFLFLHIPRTVIEEVGTSFRNRVFALAALDFTDMQLMRPFEICIIAPYSAQIKLYWGLLKELSDLSQWQPLCLDQIRRSTVDGVQGGEFDLVIADLVRSNFNGHFGFITGPNRLNVLCSPAKMVSVSPSLLFFFLRH